MADLRHIAEEILRDHLERDIEFNLVYEDDRARDLTDEEQATVHQLNNGAEYVVQLPRLDDEATADEKTTVVPGTRERIAVIVDAAAFDSGAWLPTLEAEAIRMEAVGLALRKADLILQTIDDASALSAILAAADR